MISSQPVVTERVTYSAEELETATARFVADYLQPIADRNGEDVPAVMERVGADMVSAGVLSYLRAGCETGPETGTEQYVTSVASEKFMALMTTRFAARECTDEQWSTLYRRALDIAAGSEDLAAAAWDGRGITNTPHGPVAGPADDWH
ncbi:hypothetical protein [Streptomyces sp. NBRC 110465]|uniref:hypothetical protein n=1 Tax=Streptomyces sp. NBRC 110465 TaxID=1897621 RepID=UPI0009339859|nr:hypothetical protein [Streptomyces sp. NBRC 110465]